MGRGWSPDGPASRKGSTAGRPGVLGAREPIPRRDRTCGVFGRSVRLQSGCEVRRDGRGGGRAGEGRAGAAMCPGCSRFRQHRCLAHPPGLQQPEGTREAPCLPQSVCPAREGAGRSGTCQGDISLLGLDVPVFLTWISGTLAPKAPRCSFSWTFLASPKSGMFLWDQESSLLVDIRRECQRQW